MNIMISKEANMNEIQLSKSDEEALLIQEQEWKEQQAKLDKSYQTVYQKMGGYDFLRYCRMPLYFRARIREMRIGDTFIMGQMRHTYEELNDFEGVLEIYIEKEKNQVYRARSSFNLLTKPSRAHVFTEFTFKLEKGGDFAFTGDEDKGLINQKRFALTCRYFNRLLTSTSEEERNIYHDQGVPPYFHGVTIDKNNLTRRLYYKREDWERPHRYKISQEQMPKPMMECLIDYAMCSGIIDFNEDKSRLPEDTYE
ncbi:hypothetical protein [Vibrio splendidus]|nr:hypothetical protein [Vibrio splendidus]